MPKPFYPFEEVWNRIKANPAFPKCPAAHDFGSQLLVSKEQFLSHSDLPPGTYEAFPFIRGIRKLLCKQDFNPALQEVARSRVLSTERLGSGPASVPVKPRGEDLGVVENHQITLRQKFGEIAKTAVLNPARFSRKPEHSGCPPVSKWLLGNQFLRKVVIEL